MSESKPTSSDSPSSPPPGFRGSGGTDGGMGMFLLGLALAAVSLWLFLDSVQVGTQGNGWFSGAILQLVHGGPTGPSVLQTSSTGIIFVPFFVGVFALFYDARLRWAWWLTGIGIGLVVVEILSRIHFFLTIKTSHLLLMMALFAAGTALMLRSYRAFPPAEPPAPPPPPSNH